MAAPFDASNASIFGDYIQLSGSGTAAPTGSGRGLSFLFASSSTGNAGDTKVYLVNGTGSASPISTDAANYDFVVDGDSGTSQTITDGQTLTLAGGSGLASVVGATDTVTFNVDIAGTTDIGAGLADADEILIDDGGTGTIRRSDMSRVMTYIEAGLDTLNNNLSLSDNNITNVGDINCDSVSVDDAAVGLDVVFGGNTGLNKLTLTDNLADALNITEGSNSYIKFTTTNSSESIVFGQNSTFASTTIANLGTVSAATSITSTAFVGPIDGIVGGNTPAAGTFTTVTAQTSVIPDAVGGADLGSTSAEWGDIYIADDKRIRLGNDQDAAISYDEAGTNALLISGSAQGVHVSGNLSPSIDGKYNLGAAGQEWEDIHIDGTAYLDAVSMGGNLDMGDNSIVNVGDIDADSLSVADAAVGLNVDFSSANTGLGLITLGDNLASALNVQEGSNSYLTFRTANGTEGITTHKDFGPGSDNAIDLGNGTYRYAQAHVVEAHIDTLGQALDGNSQNATGFGNLYGSAVSGSVSVGGGVGTLVSLSVAGGTVSGDVALALPNDKDVKARAFVTYSERSIKTNIQPMNNALDTVKKMQGVTYDLKNGGKNEVGFIADEMAHVVPEVVSFKEDGTAAGLDYGRLTSVLVEAIKAQQIQIEDLMSKLNK
jgi:hypothetical protein